MRLFRMNWSGNVSAVGYNDLWRHQRRMMNNWLNARAVTQFRGIQENQALRLLKRLLDGMDEPKPFNSVKQSIFL